MLRIGYPLDSHVTYKTDGTPVWDRAISSAPYRKLIKSLFSDGVLPNPSTNLQVSAGTGMKVNLYAGFAICNGCQKLQETNMSLDIATSSAVNDRIDTVILRLNDNDDVRECEFYVLTGTPAVAPVRPALTQTDSIWEIGLADVLVKANSTQISNANITDTRYETARCGIISSISEFDTTTLYQQVQADLQEFRDINQAEFIAWVDSLENKLSGDVAGNLQLQIDELNDFVDHGSLYSTNTETFKDLESGFYRLRNYKSDLFPGSVAVTGTMQKNVVGGHHTGTIITTDGVNYTRFADYDSSGTLVSDTGWTKMSVDTLTTMEQVEASTDLSKPVGAGAVQELNSSLATYFNFWIDNGYLPDPNAAPLIPVMTSNTTPYGEAFADSEFSDSIKAYMAFDGDDATEWAPNTNSASFGSSYVGYKFNNPSCAKSVLIGSRTSSTGNLRVKGFRIEASNDCISWDAIFDGAFEDSIASGSNVRYKQKFSFNNDKRYLAYRLVILSGENAKAIEVNALQFYGN